MPVNTYYFDASDAAPTDPGSVWSNETLAFNSSNSDGADTPIANGSTSSNYMMAEGTNAPSSGGEISQVRARVGLSSKIATSADSVINAAIYTDSLAELLGTPTADMFLGAPPVYGSYTTLTPPSGGWSWNTLAALEVKVYMTNSSLDDGIGTGIIELEVTSIERNQIPSNINGGANIRPAAFSPGLAR